MAIKCECDSCNHSFSVRNEFGGKKIKCPKCQSVVVIPQASNANLEPVGTGTSPYNMGLLGLLDEAGVKSKETGPACPQCAAPMAFGAVICVECGFNLATGEKLFTTDFAGGEAEDSGASRKNADQLLQKAEREIDETPIDADSQDFGDGADSYAIAVGAALLTTVLLTVGLVVVFFMDSLTQGSNSVEISLKASLWVGSISLAWILIAMFIESPTYAIINLVNLVVGLVVFLTAGNFENPFRGYSGFIFAIIFSLWYAFSRKGILIFPMMMLLLAFGVGLISAALSLFGSEEARAIIDVQYLLARNG